MVANADPAHRPGRTVHKERARAEPTVACLEAEAEKDASLCADLDSIWFEISIV